MVPQNMGFGTPLTLIQVLLDIKMLIRWEIVMIRKVHRAQNSISLSTAEAKYIAAGSACTQLMWMKQMLADYGLEQDTLTLFCDNMSAINISKNPVQHSRTKHIDIRHHFIRELVESKTIALAHVGTNDQIAYLFTKPLDTLRFGNLSKFIRICHLG